MDNLAQIKEAALSELLDRGVIDSQETECEIRFILPNAELGLNTPMVEVTVNGWLVFLWLFNGKYEAFYAVEQERVALTNY